MKTNVIPINRESRSELERFQGWFDRQSEETKTAVREYVQSDTQVMPSKAHRKAEAIEVLNFLNRKRSDAGIGGRGFSLKSEANLKPIMARLQDYPVDDLKAVIAIRCRAWSEDEVMRQYLRPATLFAASKFEQYIAEVGDV